MVLSQVQHVVGVLVLLSADTPTPRFLDQGKATEGWKREQLYSARRIPLLRLILQGGLIVVFWVNVGR